MANNQKNNEPTNDLAVKIPDLITRMTFHHAWLIKLMPEYKYILDDKDHSYEIQNSITKLQDVLQQCIENSISNSEWKAQVNRKVERVISEVDGKKEVLPLTSLLGARQVIRTLIDVLPECISKVVNNHDSKVGLLLLYRAFPESGDILTEDVLLSGCDYDNSTKAAIDWAKVLCLKEIIESNYKVTGKKVFPWKSDVEGAALESASFALKEVEEPASSIVTKILKTFDATMVKILSSNPNFIAVPYESPSGIFSAVHFASFRDDSDITKVKMAAMLLASLNLMNDVILYETALLTNKLPPLHQRHHDQIFSPYVDTVRTLLQDIYFLWRPDELAFGRQSGPFAVYEGPISLKSGEWGTPTEFSYFDMWNSGKIKLNEKIPGYVIRAITLKMSYFFPDRHSNFKRDNLEPRIFFDSSVQPLRSQYSIPISYKREFTGAVNIGFAKKRSGLWQYELKLISEYLERVVEWVIEHYRECENNREQRRWSEIFELMGSIHNNDITGRLNYCIEMLKLQFKLKRVEFCGLASMQIKQIIDDAVTDLGETVKRAWGYELKDLSIKYSNDELKKKECRVPITQLSLLIQCLLMNALESTFGQNKKNKKRIHIQISEETWINPSRVSGIEIGIYDTGKTIMKEHLPKIFDHSYSTKDAPNLGIGLWFVDQVCRSYGYLIEYRGVVEKSHSKAFCVLIPYEIQEASND